MKRVRATVRRMERKRPRKSQREGELHLGAAPFSDSQILGDPMRDMKHRKCGVLSRF